MRIPFGPLTDPAAFTGWALLALFLVLAAFNLRKKLAMLPLGGAHGWLLAHVGLGVIAIGIFHLHAGRLWPTGFYEQALAISFYLVSLTGMAGYWIQRFYPHRLARTGPEVLYEQIPAELAQARRQAEALLERCTAETGSDTLARHYVDALAWYFQKPRFLLDHVLGGNHAAHWRARQVAAFRRYLGPKEQPFLDGLLALADRKAALDYHHAVQGLMKGWLLVHLPLVGACLTLVAWHLILIHVYAR